MLAARAKKLHLKSNDMRHLDKAIALYDKAIAAAEKARDKDAVRIFMGKSSVLSDLRKLLQ